VATTPRRNRRPSLETGRSTGWEQKGGIVGLPLPHGKLLVSLPAQLRHGRWVRVKKLGYRQQRTLAATSMVRGIGLLSGQPVRLRFRPAPPDTGLVFIRTDLRPARYIPARASLVTDTLRRTTLGELPIQVTLVEHVLAALAGLQVDNCYIELDAPEPPGVDGSAREFVLALQAAGYCEQNARRPIWTVRSPCTVRHGNATLSLQPSSELSIQYRLDYGLGAPLPRQRAQLTVTPDSFIQELSACRTFVLEDEIMGLHAQGIGQHITPADILVFGAHGLGGNNLRYDNEPARHKALDLVGDLALFGRDIRGKLIAIRSGHRLNVELVLTLLRRLADQRPAAARLRGFHGLPARKRLGCGG